MMSDKARPRSLRHDAYRDHLGILRRPFAVTPKWVRSQKKQSGKQHHVKGNTHGML